MRLQTEEKFYLAAFTFWLVVMVCAVWHHTPHHRLHADPVIVLTVPLTPARDPRFSTNDDDLWATPGAVAAHEAQPEVEP